MGLKPEVLDALVAAGASAEMIVAAVKADAAQEEAKRDVRRAKDAERQRRHRAKVVSETVTDGHAESQTVTRDSPETKVSPGPPSKTQPCKPPSPPMGAHGSTDKGYPNEFEAAWGAYPHVKGRSSKPKALGYWRKLRAEDRARLPAACAKYGREGHEPKADCGAPAMDRWLRDAKHLDWLGSEEVKLPPWPGPAEFRADVSEAKGEDFTRSWLDPAGWSNGPERVILARTGFAADRIRRELSGLLLVHQIDVRHEPLHAD